MYIPNTRWERLQRDRFRNANDSLKKAIQLGEKKGYDNFDEFSQDLFSSIYQMNPKFPAEDVESTPGTQWAKNAIRELENLSEFKSLRNTCSRCDSLHAGMASTVLSYHFAESLQKVTEKNPDDVQKELENVQDLLKNSPKNKDLKQMENQLKTQLEKSQKNWKEVESKLDGHSIRQVLRKGLKQAKKEISGVENSMNAFGWGSGDGNDQFSKDSEKRLELAKQIKENKKLQEVAKIAGRLKREAKRIQANRASKTPSAITTVELGNDLSKTLPSELVKLLNPATKKVFYRSYLERSLLQYKVEGVEKKQQGPIVACVDNSGSMGGALEYWSKAVCLALLQIATDTKRTMQVIHFDTKVKKTYTFEKGVAKPEDVIEMCTYFSGGGTNFEAPLTQAFKNVRERAVEGLEKADVILISDGMCAINDNLKTAIKELGKFTGARLFSIVFGHVNEDIEEISTRVFKDVNLHNDAEIKETVFSI